jgi:hypothetical protein
LSKSELLERKQWWITVLEKTKTNLIGHCLSAW